MHETFSQTLQKPASSSLEILKERENTTSFLWSDDIYMRWNNLALKLIDKPLF